MKWFTKKQISHQPLASPSRANESLSNVYEKDFDASDPDRKVSDDEPLFTPIRFTHHKCTLCGTQRIKDSLAIDNKFWVKCATYAELSEGARSCSFCEILCTVLERCVGPNAEMLAKAGFVDWGQNPFNPVWYGSDEALNLEIFCTKEDERPPGLSIPIKKRIEPKTSSIDSLGVALNWIASCTTLHPACRAISSKVKLPTRLLSVGSLGAEHLKLVEPDEPTTWVCLTHRWGEKKLECLTLRANYENQRREIPWESFPRTFQDAVILTRRLGYQYLWIDCLCIIQDNNDDWRRESSYMSNYYGGASLTIAASGARDCEQGIFNPDLELAPQFGLSGGMNGLVSARRSASHRLQAEWNNVQSEELPILSRAWVYQERMLSRRVLHFTARELQWECRCHTACQCGLTTEDVTNPKVDHARLFKADGKIIQQDLLMRWERVIGEYSQLELSFAKDKLPALSGLAKQFQMRMSMYQYLAGLWLPLEADPFARNDNYLVWDLLWAKPRNERLFQRPKPWQAPTWAWSSVHGAVKYPWHERLNSNDKYGIFGSREKSKRLIKVLHAETTPVSQLDVTGEVSAAHLRLRGPMVEGTLRYWSYPASPISPDDFVLRTGVVGAYINNIAVDCVVHDIECMDDFIAHGEKVYLLRVCFIGMEPRVISLVLKEDRHRTDLLNRIMVLRRIGIVEEDAEINRSYHGDFKEIIIV